MDWNNLTRGLSQLGRGTRYVCLLMRDMRRVEIERPRQSSTSMVEFADSLPCFQKDVLCNIPGMYDDTASEIFIGDGILYLEGLKGCCSANSHTCARISCSSDSAIYLCNDVSILFCQTCNSTPRTYIFMERPVSRSAPRAATWLRMLRIFAINAIVKTWSMDKSLIPTLTMSLWRLLLAIADDISSILRHLPRYAGWIERVSQVKDT